MGLRRLFERRPPSPPLGEGLSPNDLLDGHESQPDDLDTSRVDVEERTPLFAAFQQAHESDPYYEREHETLGKRIHDGAEELTPSFDISSRRHEVRRSNRRQRAFHFEQIPENHNRPRVSEAPPENHKRPRVPENAPDRIDIAGDNERELEAVDFSNVFLRSANQLYRDLVAVLKLILNLLIVIFRPSTFFLLLPAVGLCTILGLLISNRDNLSSDAVRLYFFGLLATLALVMIISCATSRR